MSQGSGTMPEVIRAWHAVVAQRDVAKLADLLAEDVVFLSPVVHKPQAGKALTLGYLTAALHVLNNADFRYVGSWYAAKSAVLEFETTVDGIVINGVDMIDWNEDGRITRFKVMVRPLKAINLLHQLMAAMLERQARG
jgi:SnoaL-like domain